MVMDPSVPTTPTKPASAPVSQDASPSRTELEPTPLLLALDMEAERKRLRSRKDSVLTGAAKGSEEDYVKVDKTEAESVEEKSTEVVDGGDGKEVIIPVKEDLSQLALLGQSVSDGFWNGVEGVKKSVWGLAGWS